MLGHVPVQFFVDPLFVTPLFQLHHSLGCTTLSRHQHAPVNFLLSSKQRAVSQDAVVDLLSDRRRKAPGEMNTADSQLLNIIDYYWPNRHDWTIAHFC